MLPKEVVNIVSIVGTRSMWVANPKTVADVLAERFREAGYQINLLSDLDDLESLIRSQRENVVLINAHGESFPMHEKWGKDWLG